MEKHRFVTEKDAQDLLDFYRSTIRVRSYSDEESEIAQRILAKMNDLGYDEAYIDRVGNVIGRVGSGGTVIHFDAHMDTVGANDPESWKAPPFSADIVDGMVYGRGSVDMKGGLSAAVYAAALAKKAGLLAEKTVYVTCSVCEEYCDGACLENFYSDSGVKPDCCVICEPSDNRITLGHTGKVQARIKTSGVSAHASTPERGINAVYEMAEIITRVEQLNKTLRERNGGTIALSNISCESESLNAVPSVCEIYLDRRLKLGETVAQAYAELDALIADKRAHWELGTLTHESWTGETLTYEPADDPWRIAEDHALTLACSRAYGETFGTPPQDYYFWNFGTNAIVPIAREIPCIGFGPGDDKLAHMINEHCDPNQVTDACEFYINLIKAL